MLVEVVAITARISIILAQDILLDPDHLGLRQPRRMRVRGTLTIVNDIFPMFMNMLSFMAMVVAVPSPVSVPVAMGILVMVGVILHLAIGGGRFMAMIMNRTIGMNMAMPVHCLPLDTGFPCTAATSGTHMVSPVYS
ncbi:hypothetical protein TPL01_29080 [Sulfuriferula plumbiphila]|uniref:Uncharacterized protein n=1 Tax=Sulfuriferula plumbiphila TaxID=171865 RepID=A0A512LBA6_9PROT|nr:hypothetical protein SFPGR_18900 [Sulfuriferula plumbiphila]GEP31770.1 hypothetical protein TPL01_29080 [Sulfuriferula plumbiphila]